MTQRRVCWFTPRCYSDVDFGLVQGWALASRELTWLAHGEYNHIPSWKVNSMIEFMITRFEAGIWSVQSVLRISSEHFLPFLLLSCCCSPVSLEQALAGPHGWNRLMATFWVSLLLLLLWSCFWELSMCQIVTWLTISRWDITVLNICYSFRLCIATDRAKSPLAEGRIILLSFFW